MLAREGRVCLSSNRIWQVAMLSATVAYFRQTERGGGKEVDCDHIDSKDQCELCQLMKGVAPRDYSVN